MEKEKNNTRNLTKFIAQQMLYDHLTGNLDPERKRAVDDYLKNHDDLTEEYRSMKEATEYLKTLQKAAMSEPLVQEIAAHRTKLSQVLDSMSWQNWPDFLKWGAEAFVVAGLVAVLAIFLPWDQMQDFFPKPKREIVLNETPAPKVEEPIYGPQPPPEGLAPKEEPVKVAPLPVPVPPPIVIAPPPPPPAPVVVAPPPVPKPIPPPAPVVVAPAPLPLPTPPPMIAAPAPAPLPVPIPTAQGTTPSGLPATLSFMKTPPAPVPTPLAQAADTETKDIADSVDVKNGDDRATTKGKGLLYRMFLNHANIDEVIPTIVQEVEKMGGTKAGQVPLGWKKDASGYFHFTMPENNYEGLMTSLRYFGPVRVSIDAHPRVMPKGSIRIILMVEPASAQ